MKTKLNQETEETKAFKDIQFKPHPVGSGLMGRLFFQNGYGVSVVRFKTDFISSIRSRYGSYTNNENEWELAVLKGNEEKSELTYDTPITDDVLGYLSADDVSNVMKEIQSLPKSNL